MIATTARGYASLVPVELPSFPGTVLLQGGIVTHEFLRKLADHLEADEELDIQTAGFTKCRFPVLAKRYVVRDGEVLHADLSSPDPIDE